MCVWERERRRWGVKCVRIRENKRNNPLTHHQHQQPSLLKSKQIIPPHLRQEKSWRRQSGESGPGAKPHTHKHTCIHTHIQYTHNGEERWCDFRLCAQEFLISLIRVRRSCIYYRVTHRCSHTHARAIP